MNSRDSNSLAASSRSQSQIWRCTSGSDTRRRSGRGGKSPPRSSRAGSLLPLLPLLPDQEAVRQHHAHRVPVEARPQPALILVPAQQPLGLLVVLLHPVPPVRVLHHPLQRHLRPEVAPVVPPLAVARRPPRSASPHDAAPTTSPASTRSATNRPRSQPLLPSRQRTDRHDRAAWRRDQGVGPPRRSPPRRASATAKSRADGDHVPLAALLQAGQEVRVVAVVGVGGHAGLAHAPGLGPVQQVQGDLRLGLEGDLLGHLGLLAAVGVVGPVLGQVEPGGDRPGEGALGVVAVDGDLAVAGLAQGAGVLPGDADGALALLGEAGVVEDQDAVALGGQGEQALDALAVEVVLVPGDGRSAGPGGAARRCRGRPGRGCRSSCWGAR